MVLAQASASFGAGHRPSWRRCGFRVGTCARKWALAFSSGAGRTRFSTPAPAQRHTCANTRAYLHQHKGTPAPEYLVLADNIRYLPMMAQTLTCRYCHRKRLAGIIGTGTGWFWRKSPNFLAQILGGFGASHRPSWSKCGFKVGTCARKWALAFSSGAGHTPFSTPAPELGHTPTKTWVHLRQNLDIPAPRQGTPAPRHGRLTPAHGNIAPARRNIRVGTSASGIAQNPLLFREEAANKNLLNFDNFFWNYRKYHYLCNIKMIS